MAGIPCRIYLPRVIPEDGARNSERGRREALTFAHPLKRRRRVSAKKYTEDANKAGAYDSFYVPKEVKSSTKASGPEYITSLLQSAEVQKRG